jgi:hypothetical protein
LQWGEGRTQGALRVGQGLYRLRVLGNFETSGDLLRDRGEESNSVARQISSDGTDRRDPRNEGIVSDYFVGGSNGRNCDGWSKGRKESCAFDENEGSPGVPNFLK